MYAVLRGQKNIHSRNQYSDTGNRTPGYRVRGDNVSHYTISDARSLRADHYVCGTQNAGLHYRGVEKLGLMG